MQKKKQTTKLEKELLEANSEILLLNTKIDDLFKVKKKISKIYLFSGISILLIALISGILIISKISMVILIFWFIIIIPIFLLSFFATLIKLYRDRNKISDFFIKKLSHNFVRAYFFTDNRKIFSKLIRTPYSSFDYEKGIYLLDEKCIFLDNERIPVIFYKLGIPNPLQFNFMEYIEKYLTAENKDKVLDKSGNLLDLSYSAPVLRKFKDDKIFDELHSNSLIKQNFIIIIILVFALIIILVLIFSRGNTNPSIPSGVIVK